MGGPNHFVRKFIYDRDGGRCVYCDVTLAINEMTLDHVVPISRGGGSSESNLVSACSACNQAKADGPVPKELAIHVNTVKGEPLKTSLGDKLREAIERGEIVEADRG